MRTFVVDAFTDKPYSGNPAGVCILDNELSDELMAKIAREINHSETAFLLNQDNKYSLRWFTPKTEVSLCGHATLATAHILYEAGIIERDKQIDFNTQSGVLKAKLIHDKIELDFPQLGEKPAPGVSESIQHGIFAYFVPPASLYALLAGIMWLAKKRNEKEGEK